MVSFYPQQSATQKSPYAAAAAATDDSHPWDDLTLTSRLKESYPLLLEYREALAYHYLWRNIEGVVKGVKHTYLASVLPKDKIFVQCFLIAVSKQDKKQKQDQINKLMQRLTISDHQTIFISISAVNLEILRYCDKVPFFSLFGTEYHQDIYKKKLFKELIQSLLNANWDPAEKQDALQHLFDSINPKHRHEYITHVYLHCSAAENEAIVEGVPESPRKELIAFKQELLAECEKINLLIQSNPPGNVTIERTGDSRKCLIDRFIKDHFEEPWFAHFAAQMTKEEWEQLIDERIPLQTRWEERQVFRRIELVPVHTYSEKESAALATVILDWMSYYSSTVQESADPNNKQAGAFYNQACAAITKIHGWRDIDTKTFKTVSRNVSASHLSAHFKSLSGQFFQFYLAFALKEKPEVFYELLVELDANNPDEDEGKQTLFIYLSSAGLFDAACKILGGLKPTTHLTVYCSLADDRQKQLVQIILAEKDGLHKIAELLACGEQQGKELKPYMRAYYLQNLHKHVTAISIEAAQQIAQIMQKAYPDCKDAIAIFSMTKQEISDPACRQKMAIRSLTRFLAINNSRLAWLFEQSIHPDISAGKSADIWLKTVFDVLPSHHWPELFALFKRRMGGVFFYTPSAVPPRTGPSWLENKEWWMNLAVKTLQEIARRPIYKEGSDEEMKRLIKGFWGVLRDSRTIEEVLHQFALRGSPRDFFYVMQVVEEIYYLHRELNSIDPLLNEILNRLKLKKMDYMAEAIMTNHNEPYGLLRCGSYLLKPPYCSTPFEQNYLLEMLIEKGAFRFFSFFLKFNPDDRKFLIQILLERDRHECVSFISNWLKNAILNKLNSVPELFENFVNLMVACDDNGIGIDPLLKDYSSEYPDLVRIFGNWLNSDNFLDLEVQSKNLKAQLRVLSICAPEIWVQRVAAWMSAVLKRDGEHGVTSLSYILQECSKDVIKTIADTKEMGSILEYLTEHMIDCFSYARNLVEFICTYMPKWEDKLLQAVKKRISEIQSDALKNSNTPLYHEIDQVMHTLYINEQLEPWMKFVESQDKPLRAFLDSIWSD